MAAHLQYLATVSLLDQPVGKPPALPGRLAKVWSYDVVEGNLPEHTSFKFREVFMKAYQRLNHTKWDCKYYEVFISKHRRKQVYGAVRKHPGEIFHISGIAE